VPAVPALAPRVLCGPAPTRSLGAVRGGRGDAGDAATAAACVAARMRGAQLFRVHDVAATVEALRVADAVLGAG